MLPTSFARRRFFCIFRDIVGGFGFLAGLAEEPEIAEPVHVAIDPHPIGNTGRTLAFHSVTAAVVDIHFQVRHTGLEHGCEIVGGPQRVYLVAGTSASDETRRDVGWDRRLGKLGEESRPRIDDTNEIRTGGKSY